MKIQKILSSKPTEIFLYFVFFTGFFILLELSFFIQCNKMYFADLSGETFPSLPISVLPPLVYFIFSQLSIHFLFCIFIWMLTLLIANSFKRLNQFFLYKTAHFAGFMWGLGIVTIVTANQFYFPNSKFSELTRVVLMQSDVGYFFAILIFIFLILISLACMGLINYLRISSFFSKIISFSTLSIIMISSGFFFFNFHSHITRPIATMEKPNIILIGVDSLRPDFLSYFGHEKLTPFFDSFLNEATVFSEALTPIARTFPSWMSILTGQYPRQNGIRTNLAAHPVERSILLPVILQKQGYETIYASDETRFSNIDKNLGFDQVITPPMGVNDFLIGSLNDFPLSNLLVNTWIGQWLFPYSYGNRPAYFTYQPDSFLKMLTGFLNQQRTKPLFFAIHFCLPHSPYLWADLPGQDLNIQQRYMASVKRVDQQVHDFFALLKDAHLLDHAIVVLLSDHGEALEFHGDRITEKELFSPTNNKPMPLFYSPSLDKEEVNQSAGHGTDVLGLSQYHTVLAIKLYRINAIQQNRVVAGVVSLLDIKSTLLQLLNIAAPKMSGFSLATIIQGNAPLTLPPHPIFLESDFTPQAIRTINPNVREVMLEGIALFQIDPLSTRLSIKNSMEAMIIKSKQFANIDGEWILALYPAGPIRYRPILINLYSGRWTDNLNSNLAKHSPALAMLKALKSFYGNEITHVQ